MHCGYQYNWNIPSLPLAALFFLPGAILPLNAHSESVRQLLYQHPLQKVNR